MRTHSLCLLIIVPLATQTANGAVFEDNCASEAAWDILDFDGDGICETSMDHTTPPGYGPEVLHVEGKRVLGLGKGARLAEGTIVALYRELEPLDMDADGIIALHADYGDNVSEEHNTKIVRPHVWLEQDNDQGLHFAVYDGPKNEYIPAEAPGVGLVTDPWNATGWVWQKVQYEGGQVRAKYWPAVVPEPAEWHLEMDRPTEQALRLGFRINSGDIHLAWLAADTTDIKIAPPTAYLFPEQEEVAQTRQLAFTLFTNTDRGGAHSFEVSLKGPEGEVATGRFEVDLAEGAGSTSILLTSSQELSSSMHSILIPEEPPPGIYTVSIACEDSESLAASSRFTVLPVAEIAETFSGIKRAIEDFGAALSQADGAEEKAARLGVVHDAALAHWEHANSFFESGKLDDAQAAMRFAVEALDELKGYKGNWLKQLAPNAGIAAVPGLSIPERVYPPGDEGIRDVYSPDYLIRFGTPICSADSFVMGQTYEMELPWSVEGKTPDRDFAFEVTLESPLGHRVVARATTPPDTPTSEWQPGQTYTQHISFRVKDEFDERKSRHPAVCDEEHLLLVRVTDPSTGAKLVLDNVPTPRGGQPNNQYLAGTYYVSKAPFEIHRAPSRETTVSKERVDRYTVLNVGSQARQATALFSVITETGNVVCRESDNIEIGANSKYDLDFTWTSTVAGKLTLTLELLEPGKVLTQSKREIEIRPPTGETITVTKENHVFQEGGDFRTRLTVSTGQKQPARAQVFADGRLVGEARSSEEQFTVKAEPWFGYYDIVIDLDDYSYEKRIIATVSEGSDGNLLVNGEPFIVKGVNVHGMDSRSPARTRAMMQVMRDLGFNSWRGDFPARWQLDLAYEMNTVYSPLAQFSCAGSHEVFGRQDGPPLATARELSRLFVERYRSSAGALMWNSCNEINNETTDFLLSVYPVYKRLDARNRPVHYANLFGQDRWEGQDGVGINYYFGEGQTPEGRQSVIARSIAVAREHKRPVFYTEYNSYLGAIHSTGAQAMEHFFDWGLTEGMSGGFFYMKQNSHTHPGVFDNDFNTYNILNEAIRDAFADAELQLLGIEDGAATIEIRNKRDFTLRQLALNASINNKVVCSPKLVDIPPRKEINVELPLPQGMPGTTPVVEGELHFVTHFGFRCRVPFRLLRW